MYKQHQKPNLRREDYELEADFGENIYRHSSNIDNGLSVY